MDELDAEGAGKHKIRWIRAYQNSAPYVRYLE